VAPVVGLPAASGPRGVAITPDGSSAYVVNSGADNVTPIATAGNTVGAPIPVGSFPQSVAIVPDQGPVADFSSSPGPSGQATGFDGLASSDPDGVVAGYDWDFGDGSTLPNGGPTPTHTYTQAGTYTASLTVTDNENCSTQRVFTGQTVSCNGSSAATRSRELSISATAPREPGDAPQDQDPKCRHLRKKLSRQEAKLAKATGEAKRSMIEANLEDSKKRLKKLGCK
jgi:YVTN family beta-propeller protein